MVATPEKAIGEHFFLDGLVCGVLDGQHTKDMV